MKINGLDYKILINRGLAANFGSFAPIWSKAVPNCGASAHKMKRLK
jgi:hypothetical protein